jgi:hypothetical protein
MRIFVREAPSHGSSGNETRADSDTDAPVRQGARRACFRELDIGIRLFVRLALNTADVRQRRDILHKRIGVPGVLGQCALELEILLPICALQTLGLFVDLTDLVETSVLLPPVLIRLDLDIVLGVCATRCQSTHDDQIVDRGMRRVLLALLHTCSKVRLPNDYPPKQLTLDHLLNRPPPLIGLTLALVPKFQLVRNRGSQPSVNV